MYLSVMCIIGIVAPVSMEIVSVGVVHGNACSRSVARRYTEKNSFHGLLRCVAAAGATAARRTLYVPYVQQLTQALYEHYPCGLCRSWCKLRSRDRKHFFTPREPTVYKSAVLNLCKNSIAKSHAPMTVMLSWQVLGF